MQHVVPNLAAGHASAYMPAAAGTVSGFDNYQRIQAANISAAPPVVVAASASAAAGAELVTHNKDLLLTSSSPGVTDTLLSVPVRLSVCLYCSVCRTPTHTSTGGGGLNGANAVSFVVIKHVLENLIIFGR